MLNEKYIDEVPALNRLEKCCGCGQEFYKAWPLQSVCNDCLEETQREYPEEEEQD